MNYKLYQIICSSVFLVFAFMRPGFTDEHFPYLAEISKESVNVRAGPNTNFEKIDKLNKSTQVVVLGRSYEWLKVQPMPTIKSYIRSDYLKIKEGEDVAVVIGDNVNVRCRPDSDAASLGEIKKGTLVKVLEQLKGWARLSPVLGTAAWIHQDFLKKISDDVPVSMMIPTVEWPRESPVNNPPAPTKTVIQLISLQGTLQSLPIAPSDDVHYEIVIDDKTSFYLKDIPKISFFANSVVTVEGTIVPDPQKKLMYPLLHINKIALVL